MVGVLNIEVEVDGSSDRVRLDDSVKESCDFREDSSETMTGTDVGIGNFVVDVSLGLSVDVISVVERIVVSLALDVW